MATNRFQSRKDPFFGKTSRKPQNMNTKSAQESDDFFEKSSSSKSPVSSENIAHKKVFNKAKWRTQKYSMKPKLDAWKNKRETYLKYEYRKEQQRQKSVSYDVQRIYEEEEKRAKEENPESDENDAEETSELSSGVRNRKKSKKFLQLSAQKEKEERMMEFAKRKAEKEEALEKYRKSKIEKNKKLNRRTKRGQPVMKGRMELLLETIQKNADL